MRPKDFQVQSSAFVLSFLPPSSVDFKLECAQQLKVTYIKLHILYLIGDFRDFKDNYDCVIFTLCTGF